MIGESKQRPLEARRVGDPHASGLTYPEWEAAVFDDASYFMVLRFRSIPSRQKDNFPTILEAVEFARTKLDEGPGVYAISTKGRSVFLDQSKWDEWIQRSQEGEQS